MPAFTDDMEQYCRELSDASPTLTPNTPTTSSSPLSNEELQAIECSEAHWTGNFGQTPLSLDHPHYDEVCFHCHHLGHIRINYQFYTCPTCLCNALDHVQNRCCYDLSVLCIPFFISPFDHWHCWAVHNDHCVPPVLPFFLSLITLHITIFLYLPLCSPFCYLFPRTTSI